MKRLLMVIFGMFLLVGCEPTTTTTDGTIPSIKLYGETTITLQVGETYTDPGAYVDAKGLYSITTTGDTVDTNVAGTYTVVYSFEFEGETYSVDRTVIVEDISMADVTFYLLGDTNMEVELDSTFVDPGYVLTTHSDYLPDVDVSGTVYTNAAGEYTILYKITVAGETKTLTRYVTVVDDSVEPLVFSLNGDAQITINQNEDFVDPGFYISDTSVNVIVSGEVDTSTPGEYTITYTIDGDNNSTLTRTVTVEEVKHYEVTDISIINYELSFTVIADNPNLYYSSIKLEIYQGDTLYKDYTIEDGTKSYQILGLSEGEEYTIYVTYEVPVGMDFVVVSDEIYRFTVPNPPTMPTLTVDGVLHLDTDMGDYYSVTATLDDPDNTLSYYDITLYNEGTKVMSVDNITTGINHAFGVHEGIDYQVIVTMYYDYKGVILSEDYTLDFSTPLTFEVSVDPISDVEQNTPQTATIVLVNPEGHTVNDVVIDGESVAFTTVSDTELTIDLDTSVVGSHTLTIDSMTLQINNAAVIKSYDFDVSFTYTVTEPVVAVHIDPLLVDYFTDDNKYITHIGDYSEMTVLFDNPSGYDITSIEIENTALNSSYIISNDGQTIKFLLPGYNEERISGFTYDKNGESIHVDVTNTNIETIPYCEGDPHLIGNAEQFVDMITNNFNWCYQLSNDIDLSAYTNWGAQINGITNSFILFGNGYKVYNVNLTYGDLPSTNTYYWGLFSQLYNAHIEDLTIEFNSTMSNSLWGELYIGGLAGKVEQSYIENVHAIGTIQMEYVDDGAVGGLIGYSANNIIKDVSSNVLIGGTIYEPEGIFKVGGTIGSSNNDEMYRIAAVKNLNFFTTNYYASVIMGGVIGEVVNSSIQYAYHHSTSANYMTGLYTGGVVGHVDSTSTLMNIYSTKSVSNNGTYSGGLIGYNEGIIINAFTLSSVYGNSSNVGYVYGLNTGTFTNVYVNSEAEIYNDQSVITAIDSDDVHFTVKMEAEITQKEVYELLRFNNIIFNLDNVGFSTSYPLFR